MRLVADRAPGFANGILCAFLAALPIMKPAIPLAGFAVVAPDLIYLLVAGAFLLAMAGGLRMPRGDGARRVLACYFAAMALSLTYSAEPTRSAVKLATQIYLLGIPFVILGLVRNVQDLRRAVLAWLIGTAIAVGAGVLTLILYIFDHPLAAYGQFGFGSLEPGSYPRLNATFGNANMLCNYLAVSLPILVAAWRQRWIGARVAVPLGAALLGTALFTISPGLGPLVLALGILAWALIRQRNAGLARLALLGGAVTWMAALLLTALHPVPPDRAPFLIAIPMTDLVLAPSIRMIIWAEAVQKFLEAPLLGHGIGTASVDVRFLAPSGIQQTLTDAHNTYLSIATQAGVIGLAAMLALLLWVARRSLPLLRVAEGPGRLEAALGLAFLLGFAADGITGSFEDARHLWAVLGLFLAAMRIESQAASRDRSIKNALS